MTLAELKRRILLQVFPDGQPENLADQTVNGVTTPGVHSAFFNEALYDLQKYVPCYRYNNTDVLEHCATYFQCGYTVLPAPRGHIIRVSVLDRVQPTTEETTDPATQVKTIDPAAHLDIEPDTIGGEVTEAYTVYPAAGSSISITGATFGTGTPFSLLITASVRPDDGSADEIVKEFTVTDSSLDLAAQVLLDSATADAYTVTITIRLTGMTGSQYQWNQQDRYVNVVVVYSKLAPDAPSEPDWCSKIEYQQVDYANMLAYSRLCEKCNGASCIEFADAFVSAFFGTYRIKHRYPTPTDDEIHGYPKLPSGFHYPQSATDAGGRSPGGVWALHRGRIYIAPWIESTESVVIEWNGIKRLWTDADIVDDDPKFVQAVRLHFSMQHNFSFDNDLARYQTFKDQFYGNPGNGIPGALPELINECREETRIRRTVEAGVSGTESGAVGLESLGNTDDGETSGGGGTQIFYNTEQSYTATCPTGKVGDPITAVVEAGDVTSSLSVADANAKALQLAQERASSQLECSAVAKKYYNTQQQYTARCAAASGDTPAAEGNPVTVVIEAGHLWRTTSQAAADQAALDLATTQATAQLVCTFWNAPQSATVSCPDGTSGPDVTKTVPAHTFSAKSQSAADALAQKEAVRLATNALSCGVNMVTYWNTEQFSGYATSQCMVPSGFSPHPIPATLSVRCRIPAHAFSEVYASSYDPAAAQNNVNFTAREAGYAYAQQYAITNCYDICAPIGGSTSRQVDYPVPS